MQPSEDDLSAGPADGEIADRRVSVGLDAVATLSMAAGVAWGLWPYLGSFSVSVGGLLLAVLVYLSDRIREPHPDAPVPPEPPKTPPGPSDPGSVHISGG